MAAAQPWFSLFGGRYDGNQPCFYDRKDLPWVETLESNWEVIRDELIGLAESDPGRLKPYFINKAMSFPPRHWKTMGLYYWKYIVHGNCRKCPETVRILARIPGMTSCSLSVLEAGANINPHQGDTDAIYRCHLGLSVPGGLPDCGFQVGGEIRGWKEGEVLPFCDARTHTAWNHCREKRLVMIIDVMRPEFIDRQNSVCAHVLASSMLQMAYQSVPALNKLSGRFKNYFYRACQWVILLTLPIQRGFK